MNKLSHKPEVIIIAGPNGSGISKIISRYEKSIMNCRELRNIVDRLYIYDNSIDDEDARPLFRVTNGKIAKIYQNDIPEWAQLILPELD